MTVTPKDIKRIANLAGLNVQEEAIGRYANRLSSIVALADQMKDIDTTGVTPMAHPQKAAQRLREDTVTETDDRERLQTCAPMVRDGLYLVPRVVRR